MIITTFNFTNYLFNQNAKDLLEKLLEIDFEKRISATEAKKHPFFNSIRSEWENKNKTSFQIYKIK